MQRALLVGYLFSSMFHISSFDAVLEREISLANIWSIFVPNCGKFASLRYKGKQDFSQPVPFQNCGFAEIRETSFWRVIEAFYGVVRLNISADGRFAGIVDEAGKGYILELKSGRTILKLLDCWDIAFSPNGRLARVNFDEKTQIFDAFDWSLKQQFYNTKKEYFHFSPDSRFFGVSYKYGMCEIIDSQTLKSIKKFENVANFGLSFSQYSDLLCVRYTDNSAEFFDTTTWRVIKKFEKVKKVLFSESDHYLVVHYIDDYLKIFEMNTNTEIHKIYDAQLYAISKGGTFLWYINSNQVAHVIEVSTGKALLDGMPQVEECAFIGNEKIAVVGQEKMEVYRLTA